MRRAAFTLVELLIVIAIIGILVALLLPAIQAAREAGRIATCRNNLRQIGLSILNHEQQLNHFPFGGWGHEWIGVPGRGSGATQPGGWVYNTLPYLEQRALHNLGGVNEGEGNATRLATPIAVFVCPTRRPCDRWPVSPLFSYMRRPKPAGEVELVARGDYAINSGGNRNLNFAGPPNFAEGDSAQFVWPDVAGLGNPNLKATGVSHVRVGVRLTAIEDGTSFSYLVGEKYLDPMHYGNGESPGDNESLYSGYCSDNHRFTNNGDPPLTPALDGSLNYVPRVNFGFGSAHQMGLLMAFCDGSVRVISYDIEPNLHWRAGQIADGEVLAAVGN
jgi:prepilin-type N-terminal cleavage/methylation domain-containing protein